MDYSLLVGIHDKARAEEEALQLESAASGSVSQADRGGNNRETSESEECDSGERWVGLWFRFRTDHTYFKF